MTNKKANVEINRSVDSMNDTEKFHNVIEEFYDTVNVGEIIGVNNELTHVFLDAYFEDEGTWGEKHLMKTIMLISLQSKFIADLKDHFHGHISNFNPEMK